MAVYDIVKQTNKTTDRPIAAKQRERWQRSGVNVFQTCRGVMGSSESTGPAQPQPVLEGPHPPLHAFPLTRSSAVSLGPLATFRGPYVIVLRRYI